MQTVNFSGWVYDGDGGNAPNVNMIMVNRNNIDLQYNFTSDASGNFSVQVEPGNYDLYLNDTANTPVIYSGLVVESDTSGFIPQMANIPGGPVISGLAYLEGGPAVTGYQVDLLSGDGSIVLGTTTTDEQGYFEFPVCPVGYHQLRLSNAGINPYVVPLPVPASNVFLNIQLLKEQTIDKRLVEAEKTMGTPATFSSICRLYGARFVFTNGLMTGGVVNYMHTPGPVVLNVYTGPSSNPLYNYAVFIDLRNDPFHAMPPSANYHFTDASGDEYPLLAFWPYLHSVSYNSPSPDIVKVTISADRGQDYYWPGTPTCP